MATQLLALYLCDVIPVYIILCVFQREDARMIIHIDQLVNIGPNVCRPSILVTCIHLKH